jgi:AbiV family abortive infection protein
MPKSKRKPRGYRGRLSPRQIAAGINAAHENALRLVADAGSLLAMKRFPTAASLAILSIEEAGKISILRGIAVARSDAEIDEKWARYRSHVRKNVAWILPQLVAKGVRKLSDLKPLFEESSDHPLILDKIKQIGFYTDCQGRAHWSMPAEVIDEDLATMLVRIAKVLASGRKCSELEIELWIKHVGPVWRKTLREMEEGVIKWYAAMQDAGLAPKGPNEMAQFIRDGLESEAESKSHGNRNAIAFVN